MTLEHQSYDVYLMLDEIQIFGALEGVQKVLLQNKDIGTFQYDMVYFFVFLEISL